jgi:hypothetical protein
MDCRTKVGLLVCTGLVAVAALLWLWASVRHHDENKMRRVAIYSHGPWSHSAATSYILYG